MLHPYARQDLLSAHQQLVTNQLVAWTSGNVSCRLSTPHGILIKPSGVPYDKLTANDMIAVGIDGQTIEGALKPSTDTAAHLYIYRELPEVNAIVHTHSPAATAFSMRGFDMPCALTEMADVFGNDIPCAPYATIGTDDMGRLAVEKLRLYKSGAVLLRAHGVITVGKTIDEAVKRAIYLEHAAKTLLMIPQHNNPIQKLPIDAIRLNHERYQSTYGQSEVKL